MADRRTPFTVAGEQETLVDFLDYLRESVALKLEGLSEEDVRRPMVPSGTSLLGLVKHLARVETAWFEWSFLGLDVAVPPNEPADDDTIESVVAAYRAACARSNEVTASAEGLDQRCARESASLTLRWILVHMVEETARHAGHADILREQIDGTTGR